MFCVHSTAHSICVRSCLSEEFNNTRTEVKGRWHRAFEMAKLGKAMRSHGQSGPQQRSKLDQLVSWMRGGRNGKKLLAVLESQTLHHTCLYSIYDIEFLGFPWISVFYYGKVAQACPILRMEGHEVDRALRNVRDISSKIRQYMCLRSRLALATYYGLWMGMPLDRWSILIGQTLQGGNSVDIRMSYVSHIAYMV